MRNLAELFNTPEKRDALYDYVIKRAYVDDNGVAIWGGPYSSNGQSPMCMIVVDGKQYALSARRCFNFVLNNYKEPSHRISSHDTLPNPTTAFFMGDPPDWYTSLMQKRNRSMA